MKTMRTMKAIEDDEDDGGVVAPAHGADAHPSDESDEGEDSIRKQNGGFDRIDDNAGPGMSLDKYLPKEDNLHAKMLPSLTPSEQSSAVAESRGERP